MPFRARGGFPALLVVVLACSGGSSSGARSSSDSVSMTGIPDTSWRVLFDGTSTDAWRGYRMDSMPAGWQIEDGTLVRVGDTRDIITRDQFSDFELELEWKVDSAGNSGVMYRVTEEGEWSYHTGPEMQILDDAGHPDGGNRLTSAGSVYGLYAAPAGLVKPAGEWNTARVVVDSNHVEHWLNGTKGVEYELGSPDWEAKVKASKFIDWPGYGRSPRGHIALQDHGDRVAFRNIRIRVIP